MSDDALSTPAFRRMFAEDRLTLGVFFAIESYSGDVPTMHDQIALARRAEDAGMAAVWTRDVPLRDLAFGDAGQIYDPWVWMGHVLGHTRTIALATGAIVLPLRHPLHVAKAAASIDNLSGGRFFLGVASGDRPIEFPAFGVDIETRGERFRQSLAVIQAAWGHGASAGRLDRLGTAELLPRPLHGRIPVGVTGHSQQSVDWIAAHADAWVMYPRSPRIQHEAIVRWSAAVRRHGATDFKPFAQSLYIDLADDPHEAPLPIHLGFRLGRARLLDYLETLRSIGVNHVVLNLKYGRRPASEVMDELGAEVVPHFPAHAAEAEVVG